MSTAKNAAVAVQRESAETISAAVFMIRSLKILPEMGPEFQSWTNEFEQVGVANKKAAQAFNKYGLTSKQANQAKMELKSQTKKANQLAKQADLTDCVISDSRSPKAN